jgi:hypothetical protein
MRIAAVIYGRMLFSAEIGLAYIPFGLACGVLRIDVELDPVGQPRRCAALDVFEELSVIVVDISFLRTPLSQLIGIVSDNDVSQFSSADLRTPARPAFGRLVIPDVTQDGGVQCRRKSRRSECNVELHCLVIRMGFSHVPAIRKTGSLPPPVQIGKFLDINLYSPFDAEG